MDTTRLILILALGFVLFQIWMAWQRDYGPEEPVGESPDTQTEVSGTVPPPEVGPEDVPGVPAAPDEPAVKTVSALKSEGRIRVRTDVLDVELDTLGGDIRRVLLPGYPVDVEHPDQPFVLMDDSNSSPYFIAQGGLLSQDDETALTHHRLFTAQQTDYQLAEGQRVLDVVLIWEAPGEVSVKKIYTFQRGSYLVTVRYEVENRGTQPWVGYLYQQLKRQPPIHKSKFIRAFTGVALSSSDKHYEKFDFSDLISEPVERSVLGGWAAMLQHYFLAAIVPDQQTTYRYHSKALPENNSYVVGVTGPAKEVKPGAMQQFDIQMFIGPKKQKVLADIAPHLELTADYGVLWFLSKPIFWLLDKIHSIVGNWGWSIVFVTFIVKALFYRLSAASYRSMANMRRLQPRLLQLKERYGDDKAKMNEAMMQLYKKEKINPLGGCFPILVQIPVWIALYWVLLETVELRHAPFMFWIKDLSSPDPYFVLPVIMGAAMFGQQKLNPTPVDPMQERIMQLFPIIFTVFTTFFASGLVLYWAVNTVLSILQQWLITRSIEKAAGTARAQS